VKRDDLLAHFKQLARRDRITLAGFLQEHEIKRSSFYNLLHGRFSNAVLLDKVLTLAGGSVTISLPGGPCRIKRL
jgi:hypothetical protein